MRSVIGFEEKNEGIAEFAGLENDGQRRRGGNCTTGK